MNFQKKILVIDGDQDFIDSIREPLSLHHFNVCFADNGPAGIQTAFEFNPDLILCDINMDPIDGYQVFDILKDSFFLKMVPFVFLKHNASIEDMRHGMNLGADDFFSKPVDVFDLIKSIEHRIDKCKCNIEEITHQLNTLFQLSPIGTMVFSRSSVVRANFSARNLLRIDPQKPIALKLEDLFENSSLLRIQTWMQQGINGARPVFNERITIKDLLNNELKMNLVFSDFSKHSDVAQFIGFFTPLASDKNLLSNDLLANQVCNLLRQEKISFADDLESKIVQLIQHKTLQSSNDPDRFFSKRENQVLYLSMEGLPIKMIADKLSISSRTVEKYRTKLMQKSGASNMVEVIVFSLKNGLIKF